MTSFDPVKYSIDENKFLMESFGLPPRVAVKSIPAGVNPDAIIPILQEVYDLTEEKKHSGTEWVGIERLKGTIEAYLRESERWKADRRRGAPRFPTMHSFDSRRKAHRSGPGSDNAQVRTFFDSKGNRTRFEVDLIDLGAPQWTPQWATDETPESGLVVDKEAHRIECQICKHTESFNPDSRGSFNAARGRMSKHLRLVKTDVDAHREVYTVEFGA